MKSSDYYKTPKQDIENCITGDYKELNYVESNSFTPNVRIGEPKVLSDKVDDPNCLGQADNESHGR